MSVVWLYLVSRRTPAALAAIAMTGLLAVFWEGWLGNEPFAVRAALLFLPVFCACAVALGADSPFGELERTASLPLARLRGGHLAGLAGLGALALALAGLTWRTPDAAELLARNLTGLAGLGLLAAPLVGGRLAWIAPLAMALAARLPEVNGTAPTWLILDWPDRPAGNNAALALAFALLLAGLAAVHLFGPPVGGDEMA